MPYSGRLRLLLGLIALCSWNIESGFSNPSGSNADEESGPVFVREPPSKMDFSNSTGAEIPCHARGNPQPEIIWLRADGTAIGDVPGLRQVLASGALVFPPFRAEDYRQEVHAQTYVCLARNSVGSVHSRDVHVRAEFFIDRNSARLAFAHRSGFLMALNLIYLVVRQSYTANVWDETVIKFNGGLLKCSLPSFLGEFVTVTSWLMEETLIDKNEQYVVSQLYAANVMDDFVISGNNQIIKCNIPAIVSETVSVTSWLIDETPVDRDEKFVVNQNYAAKVFEEDVISRNAAIFKCLFTPAFIIDFLEVENWFQNDVPIKRTENYVITQFYEVDVLKQHVIVRNHAIFTCFLSPPFVMDLIGIDQWYQDDVTIQRTDYYVVNQNYAAKVYDEDIIKYNAAVFKCVSPSYVTDFVFIDSWFNGEDTIQRNDAYGNRIKNYDLYTQN